MPRLRVTDAEACVDEEEDELVGCPYNSDHRVPVSQLKDHLAVCRKVYKGPNRGDFNSQNRDSHVNGSNEDYGQKGARYGGSSNPHGQRNGFNRYGREDRNAVLGPRFNTSIGFSKNHSKYSDTDGRNVEQHTAPKGFAIQRGFASKDTNWRNRDDDYGHGRRTRDESDYVHDRSDGYNSNRDRERKPYGRSKSNLDSMDDESVRRAQRNAIDHTREFQHTYANGGRYGSSDDRNWERQQDTFTKIRDRAPSSTSSSETHIQQRDYIQPEVPFERKGGFGRGKPLVNSTADQRPGIYKPPFDNSRYEEPTNANASSAPYRFKVEKGLNNSDDDWHEDSKDPAPASERFKIMKASSVFGPVEVASVAKFPRAFKNAHSDEAGDAEEDWGTTGGQRTFTILRASDVFNLDSDSGYSMDRRTRDNQSSRHFAVQRAQDVFGNGTLGPRFYRARSPPENAKPLPWPMNRFAEDPDLLNRRQETIRRKETAPENKKNGSAFAKADAFNGPSPADYRRQESEDIEEVETYDHSDHGGDEFELLSNAETVSSNGKMPAQRVNSESPSFRSINGSNASEIGASAATATIGAMKPKVFSIYDQYTLKDEDEFDFMKPAEQIGAMNMHDPTFGSIFSQLRNFGITQSPAFGSSHSTSPFSTSMAP